MMIVTEADGLLGSCMISKLNEHHFHYIVAVRSAEDAMSERNLYGKKIQSSIAAADLLSFLDTHHEEIEFLFHLPLTASGNDTDLHTQETGRQLWKKCIAYQIPFLFTIQPSASGLSAEWVQQQTNTPFFWAGLQLPHVYGPNEYYLQQRASPIYHSFRRWKEKIQPWNAPLQDLSQPREWVYSKDIADLCYYLLHHRQHSGIYTPGLGKPMTGQDIAQIMETLLQGQSETAALYAQHTKKSIPPDLQVIGYDKPWHTLAEGLGDYLVNYLQTDRYY